MQVLSDAFQILKGQHRTAESQSIHAHPLRRYTRLIQDEPFLSAKHLLKQTSG